MDTSPPKKTRNISCEECPLACSGNFRSFEPSELDFVAGFKRGAQARIGQFGRTGVELLPGPPCGEVVERETVEDRQQDRCELQHEGDMGGPRRAGKAIARRRVMR